MMMKTERVHTFECKILFIFEFAYQSVVRIVGLRLIEGKMSI